MMGTYKNSQKGMPERKTGAGTTHNSQTYGDSSPEAGMKNEGLDEGRPHGKTGTIDGCTTGRPSGRPANLFEK